jgi:ADP-ribose pyrophosphatase
MGDHFRGPQFWSNATAAVTTVASSSFARCQLHSVRRPDGSTVDNWIFFDERPHVNVLVRTHVDRRFVVFRQSKYALPHGTLAPVGGFVEDGETPAAAAKRELQEELGLVSMAWRELGSYMTSANRGGGRVHSYFADSAVPAPSHHAHSRALVSDDAEAQRIVRLTRTDLQDALLAGRFGEVKWTATIALALLAVPRRCPVGPLRAADQTNDDVRAEGERNMTRGVKRLWLQHVRHNMTLPSGRAQSYVQSH